MNACADEHRQLITDCENRAKRLTEWEVTFIASVKEQLTFGKTLSRERIRILEEVWDKATQKG